jgi:hypothetical protein
MNTQERITGKKRYRIAVFAVAAVVVLALAAYMFGTAMQADTSASGANSADVRAAALAAQAQRRADFYADQNNSAKATTRAAALAAQAQRRADFYTDKNAAAEAARWAAAAANPYNQEWMGFTSPESVGAKLTVTSDSAIGPSTSIKPEGIRPASEAGADQLQWVKPEGIKVPASK